MICRRFHASHIPLAHRFGGRDNEIVENGLNVLTSYSCHHQNSVKRVILFSHNTNNPLASGLQRVCIPPQSRDCCLSHLSVFIGARENVQQMTQHADGSRKQTFTVIYVTISIPKV